MKKTKIKKILKIILLLSATILLFAAMTFVAHAADSADTEQFKAITSLQGLLQKLLWPMLKLSGGLMDNSLLFDHGMEERMLSIWVPVRNIVNIFFVVGLVGVALYNVLGIGGNDGSYTIKAALPKIVIGIIAINFSFIGIKVILDVVNVLTVSVFALPTEMGVGGIIMTEDGQKLICKMESGLSPKELNDPKTNVANQVKLANRKGLASKYFDSVKVKTIAEKEDPVKYDALVKSTFKLDKPTEWGKYDTETKAFDAGLLCDGLTPDLTKMTEYFSSFRGSNAPLAMAINMGKVLYFDQLDPSTQTIESISINVLFSLIMYIIYSGAFVALAVVLLERLVILWVVIVMSPVLMIGEGLPALKEKMGTGKISEMFVKSVIAPLQIAIFMSIGWIMLTAMQSGLGGADFIGTGFPIKNLNTLQDLIVCAGVIAVVGMAVFSASSGPVSEYVTGAIKGGLASAGKWVGTLPLKHIPIAGVKKADGTTTDTNLLTMIQALPGVSRGFENKQNEEVRAQSEEMQQALGIMPKPDRDSTFTESRIKELGKGNINSEGVQSLKNEIEKAFKGTEKADRELMKKIKDMGMEKQAREFALAPKPTADSAQALAAAFEKYKKTTTPADAATDTATTDAAATAPAAAKEASIKKINENKNSAVKVDAKTGKVEFKDGKSATTNAEKQDVINKIGKEDLKALGEESLESLRTLFGVDEDGLQAMIDKIPTP